MKVSPWNHSHGLTDAALIAKLRDCIHGQSAGMFRSLIMSEVHWGNSPCPQILTRLYGHSTSPYGFEQWLDAAKAVQILEDFSHG